MNCPICQYPHSHVYLTKSNSETVRRRRECLRCKHRWTTYETMEQVIAKLAEIRRVISVLQDQCGGA